MAEHTDRPWRVLLKGKKVTESWLSQQLRPVGVRPRTVWIQGKSAKGYQEDDLSIVFGRYIPRSTVDARRAEAVEHRKAEEEAAKKAQEENQAGSLMMERIAKMREIGEKGKEVPKVTEGKTELPQTTDSNTKETKTTE